LNESPDRCNLSGDGSPEAALLVAAGHVQRESAVERVDAALPGLDARGRSNRCGLDTLTVLRVDPNLVDREVTLAAIDFLLAAGDLDNERGLIVNGSTNRGRPIPEPVRSPRLGPSTAVNVEPFAALAELRDHNTIVLNEAHRRVGPAAADLADDLATAFRSVTQVNADIDQGLPFFVPASTTRYGPSGTSVGMVIDRWPEAGYGPVYRSKDLPTFTGTNTRVVDVE
jgi:hypothetical protein